MRIAMVFAMRIAHLNPSLQGLAFRHSSNLSMDQIHPFDGKDPMNMPCMPLFKASHPGFGHQQSNFCLTRIWSDSTRPAGLQTLFNCKGSRQTVSSCTTASRKVPPGYRIHLGYLILVCTAEVFTWCISVLRNSVMETASPWLTKMLQLQPR